jgi:hypothetical protein
MAATVYILCALTSLACAVMLWRGFAQSRARLLMWSSLCFAMLAVNNVLLFVDKVVLPETDYVLGISFPIWRSGAALIGLALLIYGLIWDAE